MINTFKVLFRGAATTGSSILYTAPASTTTIINNILITNTSASNQTYSILLNDVAMASSATVPANDTISLEIKQVLPTGQAIKGSASATSVNFHISGIESV